MRRVLILNSYTLTDTPASELVRIQSFLEGLAEGGFRVDENLEVDIIDSNDLEEIERLTIDRTDDPPDLIHAVGTPNAIIAAKQARNVPIVYYGAHPGGIGEAECRKDNVSGVVLTLPFTANYKNFRFVRKLLPSVRRVCVPFFEGTVFCHPKMKEQHRRFRQSRPPVPWVPMESMDIGYPCLSALCYIIGLEYQEFVYRDVDDLSNCLALVDPRGTLLMPYNDSVYCQGAPKVLARFGIDAGVPLLWNNNPEATRIGAWAAIAGCFQEAGLAAGRKAAAILNGTPPSEVGFDYSSKTYSSISRERTRQLGLSLTEEVLSYFDEVI